MKQNAGDGSYYVPAHLERAGPFNPDGNNGYNIESLRDFNNAFAGSDDDEAGQPPERWVTGTLALFDFIFVECFTVARNEGPHDGMLWLVGLQVANTNALFAPRTADHLVQQLKSTLGGTRVAVAQPQISVNDPNQVEFWKVMTLGNELSADDEIEATLCHVVKFLSEALDRFHEIARQNKSTGLRKKFSGLLFESFDAGTDCGETVRGMTVGAFHRGRHRETAVMTNQTTLESMVDQPRIAIRTLQTEPAGATQRQRCIASAIEKQQGLMPARQRDRNSLGKPR